MAQALPQPALERRDPLAASGAPALVALVLGALAMGISPIFVRHAEVGPFASAFWRVALALPLLWAWATWEAQRNGDPPSAAFRVDRAIVYAGLAFSADLLFWHLAILHTSVANATFLATMTSVWVVLGSGLLIGERVGAEVIRGMVLCVVGAAALIGLSFSFAPAHVAGDLFGLATSLFFGLYFLAVRSARRRVGSGRITFLSSLLTAAVLLVVATTVEGNLLPASMSGVYALVALALLSHAAGQGLLAYALGRLTAAFSSLVIFIEAIAAALFAWVLLGEPVSALQAAGGALILAGIFLARPRRERP